MKKILALSLALVMCLGLLAGCGGTPTQSPADTSTPADTGTPVDTGTASVTLNVVTTYAGNDSNAINYQEAIGQWEAATGNKVSDASATSDETFKARINTDFETGAEPDVLFFFNGVDSNGFVEKDKVVSIDEIRAEYPDYASNMKDGMLGASPLDGVNYSVPVNGYWEGLYVNKEVLAAAGVEIPGADYTWDQFLIDCEKIKDAGYAPIAASLATIPHYWFEFVIYNHLDAVSHNVLPVDDAGNLQYNAWVNGLTDIKDLYERGYFPANTLSATDDETCQMFYDGKAAFLIDGSWKVGGIEKAYGKTETEAADERLENITVTFVPGKNDRVASDIIGGLSSGYYITRKAWEDPEKRAAAVDFVMHMTSDEMVGKFAQASGNLTTALKGAAPVDLDALSSLGRAGFEMTQQATGISGAVQDQVPAEARIPVFDGMPSLVTGEVDIAEAVSECISLLP